MTKEVWGSLEGKDLPEGAKVITSTCTDKNKNNDTYHGSLNARGLMQVVWKHFNLMSTAAPAMNSTRLRNVLVLMLLADWTARIYYVNGMFLKGKFADGKEKIMEILQGMEHHYWV